MPAGKASYAPHHVPMRSEKETAVSPNQAENDAPEETMMMPMGSTSGSMGMAHHVPTRGDREMSVSGDAEAVSMPKTRTKMSMTPGVKKAGPA